MMDYGSESVVGIDLCFCVDMEQRYKCIKMNKKEKKIVQQTRYLSRNIHSLCLHGQHFIRMLPHKSNLNLENQMIGPEH